jgi:membrane protease YdiL (CAAX protease family)
MNNENPQEMRFNKMIKVLLAPIILAIVVKSINEFSFFIADPIYNALSGWDADNAFLVLSIHHLSQAFIALMIITVYGKIRKIPFGDFGFGKKGFSRAIQYVVVFIAIWALIQTISGFVLIRYYGEPVVFGFPLTAKNYLGRLAFQLLLSGTSEEILFRVMVIVILTDILKNDLSKKALFYYLVSVSTLIFMFDHINFNLSPLSVTHFNVLQQITLLVFGIFYGWLYVRYKNYWAVAIAHGSLNGIISLSTLLLYFLLK